MNAIPSLYLISPVIEAPASLTGMLDEICSSTDVAAVLLRLAAADERTQTNRIKILASAIQKHDTAVIIALEDDDTADIATMAARGGADGIHIDFDADRIRDLTDRLKGERSLGIGGLRNRDDAMRSGEMGVDYVMFGEPRPDGSIPAANTVTERAAWWAEIFETPCIAFSPDMAAAEQMARTGAEFVAFGDAIWTHPDGPVAAAQAAGDILKRMAAERAR